MKPKALILFFTLGLLFGACSKDSVVGPTDANAPVAKAFVDQATVESDPVSSVDERSIDARIKLELQKMTRILGLTPRQQAAIAGLLKKQYLTEMQLRRQYQNDPLALRKALVELQTRIDAAIMQLLTKEQQLKWKLWKRTAVSTRG